jgi:hypothetical protein
LYSASSPEDIARNAAGSDVPHPNQPLKSVPLNSGENPSGFCACANDWPIKTAQIIKKDGFLIFVGGHGFGGLSRTRIECGRLD